MAESKRDYYEVLGVSRDADDAALKKAYRALAKKYHPDANSGDQAAADKFKEASEAYSVLSDPEKRRQYDQFGHAAFDGAAGGAGGFGGFDFSGADMGDIFGDIFGDLFGGGRSSRSASNGPMRGANVRTSVRITFEEAIFGCEKELDLNLKEVCDKCHGTGAKPGTQPQTCTKCNGKGKIMYTQQSFFGQIQNVQTCPDCGVYIIFPLPLHFVQVCGWVPGFAPGERKSRLQFRPVSIMARACATGATESQVSMEAKGAICL